MIELERASRWYGQVIGLNDVTCTVPAGVTALLGPNGAGKSTFMKLVSGQLRPTTGRVTVLGERPFANGHVYRRLGYCPEVDSFWEEMTGREFVTTLGSLAQLRGETLRKRVADSIHLVGMEPNADRKIGGYSKGMRQRIKLAQAIIHDPQVLLLDEPLNGLDPVGRREMSALLRRFGDAGKGVLVSSHVLHEVEQMTRSILLIHHGRLLAQGDVYQIRGLIDKHPHRVSLITSNARALARELLAMPGVVSVRVDDRDDVGPPSASPLARGQEPSTGAGEPRFGASGSERQRRGPDPGRLGTVKVFHRPSAEGSFLPPTKGGGSRGPGEATPGATHSPRPRSAPDPCPGRLEVETRDPDGFYAQLPDLVLAGDFDVSGFESPDNNLEAVFRYLTQG